MSSRRSRLRPKPGCRQNKLRIAIVMLTSPKNTHPYTHNTSVINLAYANKHRYDFILERCPTDTDIPWKWDPNREFSLVWYKPEVCLKHLPNYHYVLYLDDDAYFTDHNVSIEDFVDQYLHNGEVMALAKDMPGGHDVHNTGVILVKNHPDAFRLLRRWIASTSDECARWRYEFTYEQACISQLAQTPKFRGMVHTIDPALCERTGEWIVHLYGTPPEFRNKMTMRARNKLK